MLRIIRAIKNEGAPPVEVKEPPLVSPAMSTGTKNSRVPKKGLGLQAVLQRHKNGERGLSLFQPLRMTTSQGITSPAPALARRAKRIEEASLPSDVSMAVLPLPLQASEYKSREYIDDSDENVAQLSQPPPKKYPPAYTQATLPTTPVAQVGQHPGSTHPTLPATPSPVAPVPAERMSAIIHRANPGSSTGRSNTTSYLSLTKTSRSALTRIAPLHPYLRP